MLRLIIASLMFAPLMALGADDDPRMVLQEQLQGTWVSVKAFKPDGEELSPESIKEWNHRLIISGDKLTSTHTGGSTTFEITTDPNKSPKEIDTTRRGRAHVSPGIYRVKADTLYLAPGAGLEAVRPTELKPCPRGSVQRWAYEIFQREKDKKTP